MRYTHEDGTPFSKEEFLQKLKTDKEFNNEFGNKGIDQIANLINDLKTNPDSRRLMVNVWNVGELDEMVLPPCHYGFQVYTRELSLKERYVILKSRTNEDPLKYSRLDNGDYDQHPKEMTTKWMNEENIPTRAISLMWNQRSCDVPLGLPFNIASYGVLLQILAKTVNMVPDQLIGNLGDCHIYLNQVEGCKEQITREPFGLPRLKFNPIFLANLEHKSFDEAINGQINFEVENYQSHPAIKLPLSN
jgi:thymidylate synthase